MKIIHFTKIFLKIAVLLFHEASYLVHLPFHLINCRLLRNRWIINRIRFFIFFRCLKAIHIFKTNILNFVLHLKILQKIVISWIIWKWKLIVFTKKSLFDWLLMVGEKIVMIIFFINRFTCCWWRISIMTKQVLCINLLNFLV